MHLEYVTDPRGRSGQYKPVTVPEPREALPAAAFVTQERADGLHIVEAATGYSYGIAASEKIAGDQIGAMGRMTQ